MLRWLKSHPVPSGTVAPWLTSRLTYREVTQGGAECPCVAWPCADLGPVLMATVAFAALCSAETKAFSLQS